MCLFSFHLLSYAILVFLWKMYRYTQDAICVGYIIYMKNALCHVLFVKYHVFFMLSFSFGWFLYLLLQPLNQDNLGWVNKFLIIFTKILLVIWPTGLLFLNYILWYLSFCYLSNLWFCFCHFEPEFSRSVFCSCALSLFFLNYIFETWSTFTCYTWSTVSI